MQNGGSTYGDCKESCEQACEQTPENCKSGDEMASTDLCDPSGLTGEMPLVDSETEGETSKEC